MLEVFQTEFGAQPPAYYRDAIRRGDIAIPEWAKIPDAPRGQRQFLYPWEDRPRESGLRDWEVLTGRATCSVGPAGGRRGSTGRGQPRPIISIIIWRRDDAGWRGVLAVEH